MKINTPQDIASVLRDARKSKKWTQTELADRLGVYQKDISKYELQPDKISADMLLRLCAMLDLKVDIGPMYDIPLQCQEVDF
ncbi:helix-turn-helix domain-containing protein [Idiomarina abyssalis]|uniref:helix-turn-helix domain-containing protein n=1 Tax=Idiomarina abyssalis TaxID=86102 RepID=UPI003A952AF2|tara:strand:+ start:162 stop:407 length:246 start_codon:yes stop_codon:yes gene_type:complete